MALTKAQWAILQILQAYPDYRIYRTDYRAARLVKNSESYESIKKVNRDTFDAIRPWLAKDKNSRSYSEYYYLDPQAQLTDDWPAIKTERQRQQREAEKHEQAERAASNARIVAQFLNVQPGPYVVEMSGYSFDGAILCNGQMVAITSLPVINSQWSDWNDAIGDERVKQYLTILAEFVNRANRAVEPEAK